MAALWCGLAILCLTSYFWRLGTPGILDLDEGLYTECAREMARTGDWVTPRVNGSPFFEKPPLAYWAAAACFRVFGRTVYTARLPAAAASAFVVALVFWFGRRHLGIRAGWLAAAFFAAAPLVVGEARQLTTDALLDLWVCVALVLGYEALRSPPKTAAVASCAAWAACGAGVLTKGAPGIALPALVMGSYLLWLRWTGAWSSVKLPSLRWVGAGMLLFLVIAVPWHIEAYRANGMPFVDEYLIRQHLGRFQGGDTAHRAPVWFYVPAFLLGAFPWSFFAAAAAPGALGVLKKGVPVDGYRSVRAFLWIWAAVVFLVFSAGGSKLVSYILPLYMPASLLAAHELTSRLLGERRDLRLSVCTGLAALAASGLLLVVHQRAWVLSVAEALTHRHMALTAWEEALLDAAVLPLAVMAAGPLAAAVAAQLKLRQFVPALVAGFMAGFPVTAVARFVPVLERQVIAPAHRAGHAAGLEAVRLGKPLALCMGRPRRPSVFFYLPGDLLPRWPGEASRVWEVDGVGQLAHVAALHRGCTVVASDTCSLDLRKALGKRAVETACVGAWHIVEVAEP